MHIPPYYKRRGTQYFFVGTIIGAVLAYIFFLYINGELTERWITQNIDLRNQIIVLEDALEEQKNISEENNEKLKIHEIDVKISNAKQLKLAQIEVIELNSLIKQELSSLIGNSIESLSENKTLIYSAVENKSYKVGDFRYYAEIIELIIDRKLSITAKIKIGE